MKKNLFTLCMMLLLSMLSFAQGSLTISGVVTEKKTGEPIIGASILLKGQSSGTITDFNGNYSIPNVPSGATLVFSYIGMKTQEVKVTASSKLDISLEEDNQLIDEVVVIGYGIQRKSDLDRFGRYGEEQGSHESCHSQRGECPSGTCLRCVYLG